MAGPVTRTFQCFLIKPTQWAREYLRRYEDRPCSGMHGYHNAKVVIGTVPYDANAHHGDNFPHAHLRWPKLCDCGYEFPEQTQWMHGADQLWVRTDRVAESFELREAPVGAMWFADWASATWRGPDGHCLAVQTPGGVWMVDAPASSGSGWQRTGDVPNVTAHPSIRIGVGRGPNGADRYHGWLKNGVLIDA